MIFMFVSSMSCAMENKNKNRFTKLEKAFVALSEEPENSPQYWMLIRKCVNLVLKNPESAQWLLDFKKARKVRIFPEWIK